MKKLIITFLLLFIVSIALKAQTNVDLTNLTEDVWLGNNCSNSQEQPIFTSVGDVNLNGFTLRLRNVKLDILGNLNGPGNIDGCGQSIMYVKGGINGDLNIDESIEITGDPLKVEEYLVINKDYTYNRFNKSINFKEVTEFHVYDFLGKLITDGRGEEIDLNYINENLIIIRTNKGYIKLAL